MTEPNNRNAQARRLTNVLVAANDDATCASFRDLLEPFVAAQQQGDDAVSRFPALAAHLDSCERCAEDYSILYEARLREATLPALPAPQWDLAFLTTRSAARQQPSIVQTLERTANSLRDAVSATGTRIRIALSEALLAQTPLPAPALAVRGGPSIGTRLVDIRFDRPTDEVDQIHLTAWAQPGQPELATVVVQCEMTDRSWPDLDDIEVVLTVDGAPRREATDPFGEATFEGVPTAGLTRLQVELDTGAPTIT